MIALSVAKLKMFSPESEIFLGIKPKKEKKNFSVESLDHCRHLKVRLSDHMALQNIASSSSFFRLCSDFLAFALVFRTSNFWSLRNLIKQLFHSRLLDMRLVIAARLFGYLPSHIQRALME